MHTHPRPSARMDRNGCSQDLAAEWRRQERAAEEWERKKKRLRQAFETWLSLESTKSIPARKRDRVWDIVCGLLARKLPS